MKVVFFYRKSYYGAFSIEILFDQIQKALPKNITGVRKEMRFISKGFFNRLLMSLDAAFHQGDVNHITGDVHFISLFMRKRSTILTIHDIGFMNHPKVLYRFFLKWFWLILPLKRCIAVTVVSQATKLDILKYLQEELNPKIHVIHNPLRPGFIFSQKIFNAKEPLILQIGSKYNKNLLRLIKALSGIDCRLEIVGRVSEDVLRSLQFNQIKYSISANLSNQEIIEKYRRSDIVSFVSTNEGFGFPIIEANATGRVVVTSNLSSMPEIGGNAAHFVNPFDVVSIRDGFLKVIHDAPYRERLVLNGLENIKRFDIANITSQYVELYKSIAP
jgi:glycosyltransferase involved in cell wall biosynthesis